MEKKINWRSDIDFINGSLDWKGTRTSKQRATKRQKIHEDKKHRTRHDTHSNRVTTVCTESTCLQSLNSNQTRNPLFFLFRFFKQLRPCTLFLSSSMRALSSLPYSNSNYRIRTHYSCHSCQVQTHDNGDCQTL